MTDLNKTLKRRMFGPGVRSCGRQKQVVVELRPKNLIFLRLERERTGYFLTAENAYMMACHAEVSRLKFQKGEARKAAKAARDAERQLDRETRKAKVAAADAEARFKK